MPAKRKTMRKGLRVLPPTTRRVAQLLDDLKSVQRRLKNLLPALEAMEADHNALVNAEKLVRRAQGPIEDAPMGPITRGELLG